MADGQKEERRSIRDSAKSLKKYGSTCNHFQRQDHFVKHYVLEGETMQGIALKYGVTVSIPPIWTTLQIRLNVFSVYSRGMREPFNNERKDAVLEII